MKRSEVSGQSRICGWKNLNDWLLKNAVNSVASSIFHENDSRFNRIYGSMIMEKPRIVLSHEIFRSVFWGYLNAH
jgi:phage gp29-like protein